jgi:predicted ferric reductase
LGNHTKRIAQYSEKCVSENRQALIRVDGPYGNLTFNYRRYGSLVLVGGGIGITPIISIIKDIYEKSEVNHVEKSSHCMNNVHLIWIMPFEADAALFLDQLLIYRELSVHDPSLPLLEVSIHITREETVHKNGMGPIFYSKPDLPLVMDDVKRKAEIIGASSILVFACGPGRSVMCFHFLVSYLSHQSSSFDFTFTQCSMVNRVWDASMKKNSKRIRVDFHHESFAY